MKIYIRRWVNESYDVIIVEEMKVVLEFYGGVRGCRFVVVEIDKIKMNVEVRKIFGISFFNNFYFIEDGVWCWKVYQIGKGYFYLYVLVIIRV